MKVRVLWVPPSERFLMCGKVYDLADGAALVTGGEAEQVDAKEDAEADPRPVEEAETTAEEPAAAPAKLAGKK